MSLHKVELSNYALPLCFVKGRMSHYLVFWDINRLLLSNNQVKASYAAYKKHLHLCKTKYYLKKYKFQLEIFFVFMPSGSGWGEDGHQNNVEFLMKRLIAASAFKWWWVQETSFLFFFLTIQGKPLYSIDDKG